MFEMNARRVLHVPVIELLLFALILFVVSGLGLLISFASWLIHMRSIQQPIQIDPLDLVNDFHDAVNDDNIHAMLALFAEDATIKDGEFNLNGRNEIQEWALHSSYITGVHLTMISSQVTGEKIFWHDTVLSRSVAQQPSYMLQWMADLQKGKIETLTVSPLPMPDGK
jgi:hypothetical protein